MKEKQRLRLKSAILRAETALSELADYVATCMEELKNLADALEEESVDPDPPGSTPKGA